MRKPIQCKTPTRNQQAYKLTAADVVRHALVQQIINAYEKDAEKREKKPEFKKPRPQGKGHQYQRKN